MKTLTELRALKTQRAERLKALIAIMEGDTAANVAARDLTQTEQDELTAIRTGAEALETALANAEFAERSKDPRFNAVHGAVGSGNPTPEERVAKSYSITRAAQYAADKTTQDVGLEREMHQEAVREANSVGLPWTGKGVLIPAFLDKSNQSRATAGTAADAGNLIGTNQMATIDGYAPKLFVEDLGATMHMGLTGINNIPVADLTATSAFIAESGSATAITSNVRRPSLVAKGLLSKLTNSWFLKAQAGLESDRILLKTLERSEQNALNANIIKRANSNSSHGIIGAADIVDVSAADGSALSRDMLIDMINSAANNNAEFNSAAWIVSPTLRARLQKLLTDAGSGLFVWPDTQPNQLMGFKAAVTTLMPTNLAKGSHTDTDLCGAAFGYWDQLHVASWAVRELIVDNASSDAGVVLKLVSFWDWVFANPKAFAIAYLDEAA